MTSCSQNATFEYCISHWMPRRCVSGPATFITRRVSWSSDGHSIYAAVGKGEADIVLLSNVKP